MNRKLLMLRLMLMNGRKKAEYLKRIKYFHKQGEGCYFQPFNFGTEPHLIEIGDNVSIASNVRFVNHDIASYVFNYINPKIKLPNRVNTITIGNNVFIGCDTVILYGVHIGDNVVVGGGSVISKDIPSGSVAVGVPCRVIGKFEEYYSKYIEETRMYTWTQNSMDKRERQIEFFFEK